MTWEAIFLNDIHICPTNIPPENAVGLQAEPPKAKPGSSSITTTETNSREGSKPWAVNNPLASSCLLGRSVGMLQTAGHRSFLWQLWQTQNQVAKWDATIQGGGENTTLTFCQSSVNEAMHLRAQAIADNRQYRKSWEETREQGSGHFQKLESKVATVFWARRKREAVGTSTRTALSSDHNQIHSQLPGAGVQWAWGPRHTRAKLPGLPGSRSAVAGCSANPTLRILLLDRSRRKVTGRNWCTFFYKQMLLYWTPDFVINFGLFLPYAFPKAALVPSASWALAISLIQYCLCCPQLAHHWVCNWHFACLLWPG